MKLYEINYICTYLYDILGYNILYIIYIIRFYSLYIYIYYLVALNNIYLWFYFFFCGKIKTGNIYIFDIIYIWII